MIFLKASLRASKTSQDARDTMKISTPLTRFKEMHPTRFKDPVDAIIHITGITAQETMDISDSCRIVRNGRWIKTLGTPDSPKEKKHFNDFMDKAEEDANTWFKISKNWGAVQSMSFIFGTDKVSGTRQTDGGVIWKVYPFGEVAEYFYTDDYELSEQRAEVIYLHYLNRK